MVTTMASVKLVNGHHSHHQLYHKTPTPHLPPRQHPRPHPPATPTPTTSSASSPSSPSPCDRQPSPMTLDYSVTLPHHRPAIGLSDRDGGARSVNDEMTAISRNGHNTSVTTSHHDPRLDLPSTPSPPALASSPHSGSENRDSLGSSETPTKRNKRKLSEPRKRADFSVKRLCPQSPGNDNSHSSNDCDEEENDAAPPEKNGVVNGHADHSEWPRHSSASSTSTSSSSTNGKSSPFHSTHHKHSSKSHHRHKSSPKTPVSPPPPLKTPTVSHPSDAAKEQAKAPLVGSIPPHFLHPLFSGVPPAAHGFLPGLYMGGQPFQHPAVPVLPGAFPAIPLHLHQNYIAAAAAAVAAQSAAAAASTSTSSSSVASGSTSKSKTTSMDSSPFVAHGGPPTHPVILHPPQPPSSSQRSSSSSSAPQRASSSPHASSSSHNHRPSSSRSHIEIEEHHDDEEEDDGPSSRVNSPEDLSVGGKMSRKQRKNYKNMTRERRVEANARERTRVHTISAAFDALRHAVPSYSYNQKLSKLAILRIACSYIMALARLADLDYTSSSEHINQPLTFSECVDMCTNTIQTEGRARRRH